MMMEFLYFPEDKSEYIPAFIMLAIFMVLTGLAMYALYRKSKKEEEYYDEKYKDAMFINNEDEKSENHKK